MKKKKEENNNQLKINAIVVIAMTAMGVYLLFSFGNFADNQFDNGNATSVCILSDRVISAQNTTMKGMAYMTGLLPKAKTSWIKYDCNNVLLTDDFHNTCYGSTGFVFYGLDSKQQGLWYCSNVPKPIINNNLVIK